MEIIVETIPVGALETNCYVLSDGTEAPVVVVDPGADGPAILARIGDRAVSGIVLTHRHFDHVGAVGEVARATGAPVAASASEAEAVTRPEGNLSGWMDAPVELARPEHILEPGDVVQVGSIGMTVLHTPGHTDGGICLLGGGALIAGDTIFSGGWGRTDLPSGSESALRSTFTDVLAKLDDATMVYPGHGPASTIGRERRMNPMMRA